MRPLVEITRRIAAARLAPPRLLRAVIELADTLVAVVADDVVCLAMTPVLAATCLRRGLNPVPRLLVLASTLAGGPSWWARSPT